MAAGLHARGLTPRSREHRDAIKGLPVRLGQHEPRLGRVGSGDSIGLQLPHIAQVRGALHDVVSAGHAAEIDGVVAVGNRSPVRFGQISRPGTGSSASTEARGVGSTPASQSPWLVIPSPSGSSLSPLAAGYWTIGPLDWVQPAYAESGVKTTVGRPAKVGPQPATPDW